MVVGGLSFFSGSVLCERVNVTPVVLDVCMLIISTKRLKERATVWGLFLAVPGALSLLCARGGTGGGWLGPLAFLAARFQTFSSAREGWGEGLERKHFVKGLTVNRVICRR